MSVSRGYLLFLAMTKAGVAFGNALSRVSNRAQWTLNCELVKQVEQKAIQMSHAFASKLGYTPGITIFDDFQSTEAALSSGGAGQSLTGTGLQVVEGPPGH